jgi:hypothetical protein
VALYTTDEGQPVTTQSMIKTFRQCHREAMYKYYFRLKPRVASAPLTRGKWMHSLLEAKYEGRDWKPVHEKYVSQFSKLFDEEKEKLGDLPREIDLLMTAYDWYYGDPEVEGTDWNVLEVEKMIEAELPNGHLFRGVVDLVVEIDGQLWLVDHKNMKTFPDWMYRMLDEQSTLYTWAAREAGIPVEGFIWNYISTKGFPKYEVLKNGKRFGAVSFKAETIYPAFTRAIKKAKADHPEEFLSDPEDVKAYKAKLAMLKDQRWKGPDSPPNSPYFRRDVLEKSDDLIERVLASVMRTSETMHNYDFTDADAVERDINSCKGFFCSYKDLSLADLMNGDSSLAAKRGYKEDDPLAYQAKGENIELKG